MFDFGYLWKQNWRCIAYIFDFAILNNLQHPSLKTGLNNQQFQVVLRILNEFFRSHSENITYYQPSQLKPTEIGD